MNRNNSRELVEIDVNRIQDEKISYRRFHKFLPPGRVEQPKFLNRRSVLLELLYVLQILAHMNNSA